MRPTPRGAALRPRRSREAFARSAAPALGVLLALLGCAQTDVGGESYASVVLADRPASYWRFGERNVADGAHDEAGHASARYGGGVTLGIAGAVRGGDTAASFDGTSAVVIAPDVYSFLGSAPFTIEVWIAPARGGADFQRICNHRHGPPHTGWILALAASKRVTFERWSDEVLLGAVSGDVPLDVYSHVVARFDGSEMSLWIDGALRATALDARPISTFNASLTWGVASTGTLEFFSGRIDEGAIYEHALAPDRIAAHYAAR